MISTTERQSIKKWLGGHSPKVRQYSSIYQVLSDPTRVKILLLLQKYNKDLCVSDVAAILGVSVSAISHQMSILERSNLLGSVKEGKTVCYYLTPDSKSILSLIRLKRSS